METNSVEFLIAWENGIWTTEIFEVPVTVNRFDENALNSWALDNLYGRTELRKAVLITLYNESPEEEDE